MEWVCLSSRNPSVSFSRTGCALCLKLFRLENICCRKTELENWVSVLYARWMHTSDSLPQTECLVVDAIKNSLHGFWAIAVLLEVIKGSRRTVVFPVIAKCILVHIWQHLSIKKNITENVSPKIWRLRRRCQIDVQIKCGRRPKSKVFFVSKPKLALAIDALAKSTHSDYNTA